MNSEAKLRKALEDIHRELGKDSPDLRALIEITQNALDQPKPQAQEDGVALAALRQYGVYLETRHEVDLNAFFLLREKALGPNT